MSLFELKACIPLDEGIIACDIMSKGSDLWSPIKGQEIILNGCIRSFMSSEDDDKIQEINWSRVCPVWITTHYGKFFKKWEYQATLPASWEIWMQTKKQQLEPDMEQETGSILGKEYGKAVYCHLVYLTYMQSTSGKMLYWM